MPTAGPAQFIILTYAASWLAAGLAVLFGMREAKGPFYMVFAAAYMLLPAACTAILQVLRKEKPFSGLNVSFRLNWWFLVAAVVPLVYTFMSLGTSLLLPNVSFAPSYEGLLSRLPAGQAEVALQQLSRFPPAVFLLVQITSSLIAGCTINAVFAFGEEAGWRGYLLRALRGKKFLPVSLIIGAVWGLWHLPLTLLGHNYPQNPVLGVGMMTIFCVLLTPVMIYIVVKSKSVITAAVFHGTLNAIGGINVVYLVGGSDLTNGITGAAGFAAMLLITLVFYLYDRYVTKENIFTKPVEWHL